MLKDITEIEEEPLGIKIIVYDAANQPNIVRETPKKTWYRIMFISYNASFIVHNPR